jgi:hypothetical protein
MKNKISSIFLAIRKNFVILFTGISIIIIGAVIGENLDDLNSVVSDHTMVNRDIMMQDYRISKEQLNVQREFNSMQNGYSKYSLNNGHNLNVKKGNKEYVFTGTQIVAKFYYLGKFLHIEYVDTNNVRQNFFIYEPDSWD